MGIDEPGIALACDLKVEYPEPVGRMGSTIVEKALAARADVETAKAGDVLTVRPDLIMAHDLSVPLAVEVFRRIGAKKVEDPKKLVFVQDHFQPAKDVPSALLAGTTREFALKQGAKHYFEVGWGGICHILILEKGLAKPGMVIAGADSHTLTVGAIGAVGIGVGSTDLAALWALGELWVDVPFTQKVVLEGKPPRFVGGKDIILAVLDILGQEGAMNQALEYSGGALEHLTVYDRVTIANMSAETGATTAVFRPDEWVRQWISERVQGSYEVLHPDPDASYANEVEVNISDMEPLVAVPDSPANVMPVRDLEDVEVDQVFLGSCANGSIEDLRSFMDVAGRNRFSKRTRVLVTPATQETYRRALREGIVERIVEAGGAVQTPSCGPCIGGHGGVLGPDEVCLSTSNRNFKGRMGHPDSRIYLAGPEVAAATAVKGKIALPEDVAG